MFGKKEEIKQVDQALDLSPTFMQRSILIDKDLQVKKQEKEDMEKKLKDLDEKIETKRVLIASYQKEIADHDQDRDRIYSKVKLLTDSINELEHEKQAYFSGTHKDLISQQDLQNMNLIDTLKALKEFEAEKKIFQERIQSLEEENLKLKSASSKIVSASSKIVPLEIPESSKTSKKSIFHLFSKKEEQFQNDNVKQIVENLATSPSMSSKNEKNKSPKVKTSSKNYLYEENVNINKKNKTKSGKNKQTKK